MTTKELANNLGISTRKLRIILRTEFKRFQDGVYTRYKLTEKDAQRIARILAPEEEAAA